MTDSKHIVVTKKLIYFKVFLIFLIGLILNSFISCKKEQILSNANVKLEFSTDSIIFDTVFTTIGSVTKYMKVYNKSSSTITISSIYLGHGHNSYFTMNVDGLPGRMHQNIEVPAEDSIFIFVRVTIDPNNEKTPFVVKDSIVFTINDKIYSIPLIAWGQNAYYHTPKTFIKGLPPLNIINRDTIWRNDKPHLVYGYVVVDSNYTLTIEPGTKIHFHRNSGLWIYRGGRIVAKGTKENPIVFQGDRLEWTYRNIPNQWDRIWINDGSYDNEFDWCIIKNNFIGIQAESEPFSTFPPIPQNKLKLSNTIISNCGLAGIFARNYRIDAYNLLINNCGQHILALIFGGEYNFLHCTFANYWTYSNRKTSSIVINNYYEDQNYQLVSFDLEKANFLNCIIHGNNESEILLDFKGNGKTNYLFSHSLIKIDPTQNTSNSTYWKECLKNESPDFKDVNNFDYNLKESSKARDLGNINYVVPPYDYDLNGKSRTNDNKPDAGAYEFYP